jgi:hypothetical protein
MLIPEARTIFVHVKKHSAYERVKDIFRDLKDEIEVEERISLVKSGRKYEVRPISNEKRSPLVIY